MFVTQLQVDTCNSRQYFCDCKLKNLCSFHHCLGCPVPHLGLRYKTRYFLPELHAYLARNLEARLMSPPAPPDCPPPPPICCLKYIFIATSPACWITPSLLVPSATLPFEALLSKSYNIHISQCPVYIQHGEYQPCWPRPRQDPGMQSGCYRQRCYRFDPV